MCYQKKGSCSCKIISGKKEKCFCIASSEGLVGFQRTRTISTGLGFWTKHSKILACILKFSVVSSKEVRLQGSDMK